MRTRRGLAWPALALLSVVSSSGCDGSDPAPAPDSAIPGSDAGPDADTGPEPTRPLDVRWVVDAPQDNLLLAFIALPELLPRGLPAVLQVSTDGLSLFGTTRLTVRGANGPLSATPCGKDITSCVRIADVAVGDLLDVAVVTGSGTQTTQVIVPPEPERATLAFGAVEGADGTLWTATPTLGLRGFTASGDTVRYDGIDAAEAYLPTAAEPQSDMVLAIAPAGPRALWLATAVTGLSRLDPGADALATADDDWSHGQPEGALVVPSTGESSVTELAANLAQTAVALAPDPVDDAVVYAATLDGLYRAVHTGSSLALTRLADGPALAVAVAGGHVYAGFTQQIDVSEPSNAAFGPAPKGALLDLDLATSGATWRLQDEDAVTSLVVVDGIVYAGTPRGLLAVTAKDATPVLDAQVKGLAVTALAPSRDGGFWVGTRDECAVNRGALLRVHVVDGALTAVEDLSERGFGERDFTAIRELSGGRVFVSTFVLGLKVAMSTASGCEAPVARVRSADAYVLGLDGQATRLGAH